MTRNRPYGCLSAKTLFWTHAGIAVIFVLHLLANMANKLRPSEEGLHYFMYLTHWSLMLQTLYFILLVFTIQHAQREAGVRPAMVQDNKQPAIVSVQMALFAVIQPSSLLVAFLFWTLDKPIWENCAVKGSEPCYDVQYMGIFAHGINWILCFCSFIFSKIPFYFKNCAWFALLVAIYALWTYFHFLLNIGKPPHKACSIYPADECPIYTALDWHRPWRTLLLCASVAVMFVPGLTCFYWAIAKLRDRVSMCIAK